MQEAEKLVTIEDIAAKHDVDVRTVRDRWVHKPGFPAPRYAPSPRTRRWLESEVDAWATPSERKSLPQTPGSRR